MFFYFGCDVIGTKYQMRSCFSRIVQDSGLSMENQEMFFLCINVARLNPIDVILIRCRFRSFGNVNFLELNSDGSFDSLRTGALVERVGTLAVGKKLFDRAAGCA